MTDRNAIKQCAMGSEHEGRPELTSEQGAERSGPSGCRDRNANRPGYKKTPVGWIPEEWGSVVFTDLFTRISKALTPEADTEYREIGIRSHGKGIFHKETILGKQLGDTDCSIAACRTGSSVNAFWIKLLCHRRGLWLLMQHEITPMNNAVPPGHLL